ncbi:MAG TPA: flagellar biosynthetic protein FliR [Methylomirabilota bacterium]|nr:flagellar biosynthetic protein FliR [Methylomirabilota bacterium]
MNELQRLLVSHWSEVVTFLLVLGRTSALVVGAPFWGGASSPRMVRVIIAVGLSAAIYPVAPPAGSIQGHEIPSLVTLLVALGREAFIGLAIGWTAQLLFAGVRMAGQQIEIKMGIGLSQLVDPHEGGQTSLLPALLDLLASMVFLAMNGHHLLVRALVSSYQTFPLMGAAPAASAGASLTPGFAELLRFVVESTSGIFPIALRVCAPVVIGSVLADVVLGVMSRTTPQFNLFAVILPVQLAFGLVLLFLTLPLLVWFCVDQVSVMSDQLSTLFQPIANY